MPRQFNFGTGTAYALPLGGGAPVPFGSLSGATCSFDGDVKSLYGTNQYPDDVAVGKKKITGKFTWGRIDLNLANQIFFGQTVTTGQTLAATNPPEIGAVLAAGPYTYTATNGANFSTDLGVSYVTTGQPLTQVAAGPTVGQYTVSPAGLYTFAAADANKAIAVQYSYASGATGQTLAVNNTLMGSNPVFQLNLVNSTKAKAQNLILYSCVSSKFDMPFKQDDYTQQSVDYSAFANGGGQVFNWSTTGG